MTMVCCLARIACESARHVASSLNCNPFTTNLSVGKLRNPKQSANLSHSPTKKLWVRARARARLRQPFLDPQRARARADPSFQNSGLFRAKSFFNGRFQAPHEITLLLKHWRHLDTSNLWSGVASSYISVQGLLRTKNLVCSLNIKWQVFSFLCFQSTVSSGSTKGFGLYETGSTTHSSLEDELEHVAQ